MKSQAQIIATVGPASSSREVLFALAKHGMDVVRLNFSWGKLENHAEQIEMIRGISKELNKIIPVIQDIPGRRIQKGRDHFFDDSAKSPISEKDMEYIKFGAEHRIEYLAMSFVTRAEDINIGRAAIREFSGTQRIIAKIEMAAAFEALDEIIGEADAVMIARGDLGSEVPLEKIPFIQADIINRAKKAGKPVITATGMLLSMTENLLPARAEVSDVANAIMQGSDAVMLSEETALGKHPVEVVAMMRKIILEAELNLGDRLNINQL